MKNAWLNFHASGIVDDSLSEKIVESWLKSREMGVDPIEGPLEMLSSQGLIGLDVNGELSVHLHMLVSDRYMRVYGGHFIEGGNIVAATGEIVIHEVENIELNRQFDEQTGFEIFKVKAV